MGRSRWTRASRVTGSSPRAERHANYDTLDFMTPHVLLPMSRHPYLLFLPCSTLFSSLSVSMTFEMGSAKGSLLSWSWLARLSLPHQLHTTVFHGFLLQHDIIKQARIAHLFRCHGVWFQSRIHINCWANLTDDPRSSSFAKTESEDRGHVTVQQTSGGLHAPKKSPELANTVGR